MEYPVVKNHFKVPNEAPKVEIPIRRSVFVDSKYEIVGEFTSNTAKDQYDILQERSEDNLSKTDLKSSHSEQHLLGDLNQFGNEDIKVETASLVIGIKRKFEAEARTLSDAKMRSSALADEKKIANLRKNIRDVMGENQLDTNTIVAQREESERLARVAEQQKIIREYQRQTAVNKQNVRTQNRVISLLQSGNTFAKITDLTDDGPLELDSKSPVQLYNSNLDNNNQSHTSTILKKADSELNETHKEINSNSVITDQPTFPVSEVVTIEDSSSEDDCILLSDEEDEDLEQEIEDDPSNSGLHVKDAYNVPDEQGRVVVNIGHHEGDSDIFVAPQIAKSIKPHQIGGVRFLFDNIIESIKRFNSSTGFGCILAHSMGLGKTMQVVCFCDIFLRHTDSKTVLCVMPINTLQNWVSEFNMWIPMESNDIQQVRPRSFKVFVLNDQQKTLNARGKVILKWAEEGGVLLMGYELFRLLALKLIPNRKRRIGKNCIVTEKVETEAHKRLSENIYQSLVKPGPDLVICDEGHRIKNSHAGISLALKQIRTRRRIVLTGYPLQNNLMEYWCMVDFVRPNYLGTRTEFSNMFERPIQNGQCIDSTPEDIKLMRFRAHVLHSLLVGFVQRRSHVVLQHTLPQKLEYVILTKMNDFQRKLYDTFMNDVVRKKAVPNPLKAFAVCCKIWNHPDVLYNFLKKRETDLDLEIDDGDGTPDSTTSLKDNLNKNDNSMFSKDLLRKSETILVGDPGASKLNLESKLQSIDLKTPHHISSKSHFLDKESDHGSKTECKIKENKIATARFNSENFSQNYYTSSQSESFLPECNGETYWHDSNTPYYGYQSLCGNIGHPLKPDYVGIVIKPTRELENTNSSQIVDLDTKEIKIVETDIDVTINQLVNNISSSETETLKHMRSKYDDMCEKSLTNSSKINSIKTISSNNSNSKTFGNSGSFEKDSLKGKGEDVIPYDWAADIMKGYEPNLIRNSPKMEIFFCILNESIKQGDRVLLFSQSLLTLNLIETFLQSTPVPDSNNCWAKNSSYYRLDGSTTSQEREKLVNDFNSNSSIMLFLISTKAGSLGINLVGANRVIVFDASWNPCHDTQAVYRIYRYGQQKPCFVYRIVMDKCLEKKIYDRQVKKQGMSDRVVDECNPDAHLSMKDVTNLCYDYDTDLHKSLAEFQKPIESYNDIIIQKIIETNKDALSKEPFHHESLLIDRKEKKLSLAEKRQAQRGYELEKKASSKQIFSCQANKLQYRIVRNDGTIVTRPVASVRPMQTIKAQNTFKSGGIRSTRWIPAEVWQRQGMTAQEMTLPLDVVIPTNSSDKTNIILKSGQRVMVLKSPKGIYMQLESGKIIAIRTSSKINPSSKIQKESIIDITTESSKTTKQSSVVTKDHTEFKSMEKSTTNTYTVEENTNTKTTTGFKAGSDVVIINEEKISKTINSHNKQNFQKQIKSSATQKKNKFSEDFAVNKIYPKGTEVTSEVCNGSSLSSSMNNTANTVNNENHFQNSTSSSKIYITDGIKEDDHIQCKSREFPAPAEMTIAKESFPEQTTNSQTSKAIYASSAFDSRDSPTVTEKPAYTCNIRQGKFNPEFDMVTGPQPSTTVQISPQIHKMQKSPHLSPILQQRPHDQRETFASVFNTQHSHYVDKIQQDVASRTATNALLTNLESTHHPQYYDTMYENGVVPSYEYPAHRYSNYNSHNTYVNPETHYHPHFHNFNNTQTNAISTHPYYMHWPPPMSTVAQSNNQHNLSPPYSQNGSSTNQWHNQR